jgi:MFS family permease
VKKDTNAVNLAESQEQHVSWLPLIVILLAQIQMAFNVFAIPVSVGAIVDDFGVSPTDIGTALVVYSLFVAAFVMVGAKIGRLFGERLVFQVSALIHGVSMALMAFSQNLNMMYLAQGLAGLAAALLVPTLVVLIVSNYRGKQQAQALGILAGTPAISGALAYFVAGVSSTIFSWRVTFGLLMVLSVVVIFLSFRLNTIPRQSDVSIDLVGTLLSAAAIIMISLGFNNLNYWGVFNASENAPFSLLGLSPALFMIILGVVFFQAFFFWIYRRIKMKKTPLLDPSVLETREERANITAMLIIGAIASAVTFLIPIYIQVVQDRSSLFTAIAVIPYTLSVAISAILVVRLFNRIPVRKVALISFLVVTFGLAMLGVTISNEWSKAIIILFLILVGLGEGTLLTLLFNVMASASPKEASGDVGALRGVANNLATGLGTAFASLAAVGLLSFYITNTIPMVNIPDNIMDQLSLDNIDFITNDQLKEFLETTTDASAQQVLLMVRTNESARLTALRGSFLILAGLSLFAIIPSLKLPEYLPGEIPESALHEPTDPEEDDNYQ